jgi:hypothetical protein
VADRRKVTGRPSSIKRWRQGVLRDSVCFKCGAANQLHAHHADSYSGSPSRRLDPTNGVALCARHHREFHAIYGRDEVRQEQLHEYLGYPPIERTVIDLPLAIPSDEHLRLITEAVVSGDLEKARWYIEREIARIKVAATASVLEIPEGTLPRPMTPEEASAFKRRWWNSIAKGVDLA